MVVGEAGKRKHFQGKTLLLISNRSPRHRVSLPQKHTTYKSSRRAHFNHVENNRLLCGQRIFKLQW